MHELKDVTKHRVKTKPIVWNYSVWPDTEIGCLAVSSLVAPLLSKRAARLLDM